MAATPLATIACCLAAGPVMARPARLRSACICLSLLLLRSCRTRAGMSLIDACDIGLWEFGHTCLQHGAG